MNEGYVEGQPGLGAAAPMLPHSCFTPPTPTAQCVRSTHPLLRWGNRGSQKQRALAGIPEQELQGAPSRLPAAFAGQLPKNSREESPLPPPAPELKEDPGAGSSQWQWGRGWELSTCELQRKHESLTVYQFKAGLQLPGAGLSPPLG